jgi:simple sugar transport system permease protein
MIRREALIIFLTLLVTMAAGSLLILLYGQSPARVYGLLLAGTWLDAHGFGQVIFKTTPLIMTGLSVALALKAGLFNIGATGQLVAGSFLCALVGAGLPAQTPAVVALTLAACAAALGGAVIGAIPGWLRARFGAHEVINTIMLNFIVAGVVLWLGNRWFFVGKTTHTREVIPGAVVPSLGMPGSAANASVFFAILLAVGVWLFFRYTRGGFAILALGQNPTAAENAGIRIGRTILFVMIASGALAGLAGVNLVLGYKHYFEQGMGVEVGFVGIAVALLGRSHPLGVVLAAIFFGTLSQGGLAVSSVVPRDLIEVLQGVTILAIAATSQEARRLFGGARA